MGYSDGSIHQYIDYKLNDDDILDILKSAEKYFTVPYIKMAKTKPFKSKRSDEKQCFIA